MPTQAPHPQLLQTYRLAIILKFIGIGTAIMTGYLSIANIWLPVDRWWLAAINTAILLIMLWPGWYRQTISRANRWLIFALACGIIFPHIELIQSTWSPYQELVEAPGFTDILNLTWEQVINIHAFGQFFVLFPVVLASWQYRFRGMVLSLVFAGLCYVLVPLFIPADAMNLIVYAVRGFVLLGMMLILALTTYFLAEAQRQEQAKLADANRKLAEQALRMEQLAADHERTRLARELHDTLAHALSGTAVQLEAVKTLMGVDPAAAEEELSTAQSQLKLGLTESRRAIRALRASPVAELGLWDALESEAKLVGERSGLRSYIDLQVRPSFAPAAEQAIYRIVQEALFNVERHAMADQLWLTAGRTGDRITIDVKDNGVGFDPKNVPQTDQKHSFGLIGMQERAQLIQADLQIASSNGEGTVLTLILDAQGVQRED